MQATLTVTGMTCGHCEAAVRNALLELDPQAQVQVDRNANRVQIDTQASREAIEAAIRDQGYTVGEAAA